MKSKAWLILCVITIIAGVALGYTNLLTKDSIAEQEVIALNAARTSVMASATEFVEEALPEGSSLTSLHRAVADGNTLGYVGQTTVQGFGGPIVVVMGVDNNGTVTGISVGGSDFAETANLGTRTREPEFTDRFPGLTSTPVMNENVDAISGVTVSSSAVISGAAQIYDAIAAVE